WRRAAGTRRPPGASRRCVNRDDQARHEDSEPMRPTRLAALPLLFLVVAACGSTAPSTSAAPTATVPPPTPVGASPTPAGASAGGSPGVESPAGAGYWLRMTTSQAIPPLDPFGLWPAPLRT